MRILFAPMEGFTGYTFRNVHHRFYAGIAEYYTPFLALRQTRKWKTRERKDIDPANNEGISVIPQLLTNKADDFLWAAESLASMGYHEINLNLGCPSSTVVTKHKGAGFLDDPEELDAFFSQVFANLPPGLCISVKTRLGIADSSEMEELLPVFNHYPLKIFSYLYKQILMDPIFFVKKAKAPDIRFSTDIRSFFSRSVSCQ